MSLIICIDFDGTMVEHDYPRLGGELKGSFYYMRKFIEHGAKIILFTMRSGPELKEAVDWIEGRGITLHGVNANPTQKEWTQSPKAYGQLYIDDAAFGCPLIYEPNKRPYVNWEIVGPSVLNFINTGKFSPVKSFCLFPACRGDVEECETCERIISNGR